MTTLAERLDAIITRERPTEPFSGVVSLRSAGAAVFERAYGAALRAEAIPNQVGTRFQIASGSKIFTAVAICQLIERGALAPETPLAACLDAPLPQLDPQITIHQLLTHTAGIPDYFDESVMDDYEALWRSFPMYTVRRPADLLPLFQHQPMKSRPGSAFSYNNAGFVLLGLVVEQHTGMAFAEYVAEHVLRASGMAGSGYFAADQLPPRTARAYIANPDGTWRSNVFAVPVVGQPDGGAYTTAEDMARFWQALAEHRLLGADATRRLLTPHAATGQRAPYGRYGYGVWIDADGDEVRKYFVEGSDPGVAFRSGVYPARQLALTVLGNTGSALWPIYRELEAEALA